MSQNQITEQAGDSTTRIGPRNVLKSLTREKSPSVTLNFLDSIERFSNNSGSAGDSGVLTSELQPESVHGIPAPCRGSRYMLVGTEKENGVFKHLKIFCKSYRCKYCGPVKVWAVKKSIEIAIKNYGLKVFSSLTLDPKKCSEKDSAVYIRRVWNKFRTLQKREFGKNVNFVCVIEFQKSGFAHLHVLFDQYIGHAWLKRAWSSVGGGTIVDVREADIKAAGYLAKYLGKTLSDDHSALLRRVTHSRDIPLMKLLKKEESKIRFEFFKEEEKKLRDMLKGHIVSDVLDKKNHITGFLSSRRINL